MLYISGRGLVNHPTVLGQSTHYEAYKAEALRNRTLFHFSADELLLSRRDSHITQSASGKDGLICDGARINPW